MDKDTNNLSRLSLGRNASGQGVVLAVLSFLCMGAILVHSAMASVAEPGAWYARVDTRHIGFAVLGLVALLTLWRIDYRALAGGKRWPWLATGLLVLALILSVLVFVPGVGHAVGGRHRWIRIGPREYSIGFQPSELLKWTLVIFLAAWLSRRGQRVRSIWTFLACLLVVGGAVSLVVTEDFGMTILMVLSALVVMFLAGVPWYYVLSTLPVGGVAFWYLVTHSEQKLHRVMAMLEPWDNSNPSAYHVQQAILAVLGGGWRGVGPGAGVRKLGFLPEDSTDFLFASFCEEWGLRGSLLLMGLLVLWMVIIRQVVRRCEDPFGRILAGGLGAMVVLQAGLHIAVNLVLLPPTGIPMPFLSAGGTGLVVTSAAAALIVSVSSRPAPESQDVLAGVPLSARVRPA